ncbi:hypothetical protein D0T84_12225 [Dysgonomonas sp. 521]|nr:hypothetical protein [Dysgonomonas sp. 521]NDV95674.1 hypothetical protein [Dysgonomonas sp. 521]
MLLVCFSATVSAQSDSVEAINPVAVQERVEARIPDQSKIEKFQKDPRFQYKREERSLSWWDKLMMAINDFLNRLFGTAAKSGVLSVVVVIIIVVIVCLIVLKLLGVDYRTLLGKKELDKPEIDIYSENVHEMNFDVLIANALKNKDYRLAVRFLYLKNLKQMSDRDIIEWSNYKTNYSYQYEIQSEALRSKFMETTLIFDYVWYGEFQLDESRFSDINRRMDELNKMISYER